MDDRIAGAPPGTTKMLDALVARYEVKTALGMLSALDGFKITSTEDREQASDTLNLLRRGERLITVGLTEAFRPIRELEAAIRIPWRRRLADLDAGSKAVEREMRRWDTEAEKARKALEAEQQRLAAEAAQEQALAGDDDAGLPPAQIALPPAPPVTRGAVGKDHYQRRIVFKRIVDVKALAAGPWAHCITVNARSLEEQYKGAVRVGALFPPVDDQPIVVEGVEFEVVKTLVSGRA